MSEIPKELLDAVDEHTEGGFVIFYTNEEGDSVYQPYTDSSAITAGLLLRAKTQANALEKASESMIVKSIVGTPEDD